MIRHVARKSRQLSSFRPRLTPLEARDCPSCTVFQRDQTLYVQGDAADNAIAIGDTRTGEIAVTCDRGDTAYFTGVQRILVAAGDGNDVVTATFAVLPAGSFQFRADLGDGNDRLSISGFDPQPDPPSQDVTFDLRTGAGDDLVDFDLGNAEINGEFFIRVDTGIGVDGMSVRGIVPCVLPESELRISLLGGPGVDALETALTGLQNEGGQFALEANGGDGNDRLTIGLIVPCITPQSASQVDLNGNAGDDAIDIALTSRADKGGRFALSAGGGDGADRLSLSATLPGLHRDNTTHIALAGNAGDDDIAARIAGADTRVRAQLDGRLALDLDGGSGDDGLALDLASAVVRGTLQVTVAGDRGADQSVIRCGHDVAVFGTLDLSAWGGVGNDAMDSQLDPCILPGSRGRLLFDGGAGNDRIATHISQDEDDGGELAVFVLGGAGDDELMLTIATPVSLLPPLAVVDGGDGYDLAQITPNVRAVNCEEVRYL